MTSSEFLQQVENLKPREFENLAFDMLQAVGMLCPIWRTPGPDGGRDIEGIFRVRDASGYALDQKWYVECKRYASSIDWPTVFEKISYAEVNQADFLLIVTNSNPSPTCETKIDEWNCSRRPLKIRVWRGYELEGIISQFPGVALKYGLIGHDHSLMVGFFDLVTELMKIVQAAYSGNETGLIFTGDIETAAALSELLSLRIKDLEKYGRVAVSRNPFPQRTYDWIVVPPNPLPEVEECSLRAILSAFRRMTNSSGIEISCSDQALSLKAQNPKLKLGASAQKVLVDIALWTQFQLTFVEEGAKIVLQNREDAA